MIPSRPCVATNSEIGAGEEDEIERRSFTRPTQLSRSSKTPTFAPQAIDPVVGPCPQIRVFGPSAATQVLGLLSKLEWRA
ncbi:unnamed protein product [Musa acuminata subsp. malaccensis]|uniref:(wild Malaysian banana) hypothetical protein n=1 Tax=Musa acuminata subsp. malaccensis TaxID=214687 RepID=A0A804KKB5_MUSAM|nr:unnamed protein product [Musa acuminata subsp. malaccensis]